MLVETQPGRAELFKCDETVHHAYVGPLLGEKADSSSKTFCPRL
jgi:hypothetical protein